MKKKRVKSSNSKIGTGTRSKLISSVVQKQRTSYKTGYATQTVKRVTKVRGRYQTSYITRKVSPSLKSALPKLSKRLSKSESFALKVFNFQHPEATLKQGLSHIAQSTVDRMLINLGKNYSELAKQIGVKASDLRDPSNWTDPETGKTTSVFRKDDKAWTFVFDYDTDAVNFVQIK